MRSKFFWRYLLLLLPAPALALMFLALAALWPHLLWPHLWMVAVPVVLIAVVFAAYLAAGQRVRRRTAFLQQANALQSDRFDVRLPLSGLPGDQLAEALNAATEHLGETFSGLQSSRARLEALLDSLQEGVIAVDTAGRVTWANAALANLTGRRGQVSAPLVHTVRDPDALALVQAVLADGQARRCVSRSIADGRLFEVGASPMPAGAVVVLTEITEKAQMEATRRDFIANVSHELRTPLTSIRGYVETLQESETLDDEQREFLSIILKNARRMGRLTDDLLALARMESGERKLQVEPIAASTLINDVVDSLAGLVDEYGLVLEVAFSTEREVMADRDAVHQVLSNLVENAARYAAEGGRILLGAVAREREVDLFVRDFGPGIRAEHLARIFERFFRVDKARSMEGGGTGLGLAIAKHIAMAHGGSLRAESVLNRGATFVFTLPTAAVVEPAVPEKAKAAATAADEAERAHLSKM